MAADAASLTPAIVEFVPSLVSDGGGLPFAPAILFDDHTPLDPDQAPVRALLLQIDRGAKQAQKSRFLRPRAHAGQAASDSAQKLSGWRALALSESEILYGKGQPPQLLTVAVRKGRRDRWEPIGVSNSRPLRAARDGVRASSWRLDPEHQPTPQDTELRLLVTEQTNATGRLAADRMLAPDLYLDSERVVLRLYVKPVEGYTGRTRRHETAVTVRLPEPLGQRTVVDGALYEAVS